MSDNFGIDWLVVVVIPESDFTAQIDVNNRLTANLIVGATLIATIFGILLARRLSASADDLTRSVRELAEGKTSVPLRNSRIREIDILVRAYDKMAEQIVMNIARLTTEIETRRDVESSLRESELRLWEIMETVEMIAVILAKDGSITYCNPHLLKLTNWKQDEILGKNWFESFIPSPDRSALKEGVFQRSFENGDLKSHHVNEIITRSGEPRLISWNNTLFRDHNGTVVGTVSLGEDITERVYADKELRRRNQELAALVEISQRLLAYRKRTELLSFIVDEIVKIIPGAEAASLWEFDDETATMIPLVWHGHEDEEMSGLALNPNSSVVGLVYRTGQPQIIASTDHESAFETLGQTGLDSIQSVLGVPLIARDQIIGVLFVDNYSKTDAFTQDDLRFLESIAYQASLALENARLFRQITKHADELEARIDKRTIELRQRVEESELLNRGMVNLMGDIQKANRQVSAAADRLAIANEELEAFAYSVSHDLRAPLRGIQGFAEILADRHKANLNEQGQEYIDYLVQASNRMAELIDDLLEYSRMGRRTIRRRPVNLDVIVNEVLDSLSEIIRQTQAEIALPSTYPIVLGDRTPLLQIFLNLFDNAMKYHQPDVPPKVEFSWRTESGQALIQISDNGIGIPEEHHEQVFVMFQRLHAEDDVPGTGIGLALVRKAAMLMDGDVEVVPVDGEGTTFVVKLSLADDNGE